MSDQPQALWTFLRGFTIWRFDRFNSRRGRRYGIYMTRWFFLTNYTFPGEKRYYMRVTEHWGKTFGGVRDEY